MFIDEATIFVRGGDGGNGCVSFRREKYIPYGGPNGGNGGRGGSVYLTVSEHVNTLFAFSRQRHHRADSGKHGQGKGMQGASGSDLYVQVPPGTVVRDPKTGEVLADLTEPGHEYLAASGGRGGRGNEAFKSPTNHTPKFAERGAPGEERKLSLELRVIADVGLLGKPNAGKSTLLSSVSGARPKIAAYPFTTLEPYLGVVEIDDKVFVMADIPGLIEGAHEGVGLGHQFLRHVERTRMLIHLLDGTALDPAADYRAINQELAQYSPELAAKPQIVALNKMDLPDAQVMVELLREELAGEVDEIHAISAVSHEGVRDLLRVVARRLDDLPREEPKEQLYVFRPREVEDPSAFQVVQEEDGIYRISGAEIERLARMTDWSNEEGMERFWRIMVARGIAEQMDLAGVELGDTVMIGELELEWQ